MICKSYAITVEEVKAMKKDLDDGMHVVFAF